MKKVCSLLLAILIVASLAVPAFAASSVVTVKYDKEKPFAFEPGSGYHVTDLFDNFKNVMPGDKVIVIGTGHILYDLADIIA